MEEELKKSEEQLELIFEYAPDAIYLNDLKGNFIDGNRAAEKLTGYKREELIGKNFLKLNLLSLRQLPKAAKLLAQNVMGQPTGPDVLTLIRKNGEQVSVEISTYPVKLRDGLVVMGIARDITERKRMEERLRDHSDLLEREVVEKTTELLDAERMVTAGKIASMVGHDLRGPLQTIKNSLYLMEKDPDSNEGLRETIGEAVDYAVNMLEELRLNVGDSSPQLQEVNLGSLIRRAVVEASIPDSVEAEVHMDDGLNSVNVDPLMIRRVLDNLVRNSIEAMPDGGSLDVSSVCEDHGVLIRVKDSGMGIPDDLMHDLFKAFVTTKSKGMGLGLAYCKRAVEAHGGTITVESEVGVGTTFTVRLPLGLI